MSVLSGAVVLAVSTLVLLITFWWEHDLVKVAIERQLQRGDDPAADDRAVEALGRERTVLMWVRVLAALGMLAGIVIGMLA
jgi:uncharacterized membrane protein YidH (DUF202 family)